MTNEEKFKKGIVVYKNDENDYVCELWGASTKHPDSVFHMNHDGKYKKSGLYDDDKYEVYQWLLWIASNLTWRFYARNLAEYAVREWYDVEDQCSQHQYKFSKNLLTKRILSVIINVSNEREVNNNDKTRCLQNCV